MSKMLRSLHTLIIACLLLCLTLPVLAAGTDTFTVPEVTVGISEYPGYASLDDSGNLTGADVEYAYRIAQYANLRFKIVLINDAEDYFGALDSGRVDMLFDAIKTQDRMQKYLYASHEIGSTPMSVYVRPNDGRFEYGKSEQLAGKVYGTEKDSEVGLIFQKWCREHGFNVTIREYKSSNDIDAAILSGVVDAGLYGTEQRKGFRTILLFSPSPYYIIFRKDSQNLKNTIDDAMARLLTEDPLYADKLAKRYMAGSVEEMRALTHTEEAYLAKHPVLKIAVVKNDQPYFSRDDQGKPKGVLADFYARVTALTGLKFEFVNYPTHGDAVAAVKNGQADILGLFSDGQINAYNSGLRPTREYGTVNMVFVAEAGLNRGPMRKVAVKQRTRGTLASTLTADKQLQLVTYANGTACFNAMKNHEVDAMICGLPTASWIVNQNNVTAYSIAPVSSLTVDLCGAVAYGNETLCSILNKAIKVSEAYFDGIVASNTAQESSWSTFIARIPPIFTALFAVVMLVLVAGLILALISLSRRSREKAAILAARAENEQEKIKLEAIAKNAEEKNQFFSNISHDMRTPLNAIIGFSSLASKENVSGVARDYLSKIQSSGELLLELINDTLNLSKLNSGKLKLRLEPVACADIFNSVVIPIREAAETKNIEFTATKSEVLPYILADRLNLQKVILNLLTNAVKYTPSGGHVSLSIGCDRETDGKYKGFIIVKDDGIGISPEFLPHIYEPFAQEQSTGYEGTGTGLGLAIVKQLVDLMGGTITVDTVKGKGTTFTIKLPIQEAATPAEAAAIPLQRAGMAKLAGKKILLCEDNALNREIAGAILKKQGMVVTYAENGQKGVDIFKASAAGEYVAIFMDLRMPVLDGFGATSAIRGLPREDALKVPIIAMTADVFAETVEKCLTSGMNAHLSKPVDPDKMYQVLEQLVD